VKQKERLLKVTNTNRYEFSKKLIKRMEVRKLKDNLRLKELIIKAQNGDAGATEQFINRLLPLIKKHSYKLGYDDAYSDLTTWILEAIHRYKPNTIWEINDLDQYLTKQLKDENDK
jgi:hypothetical protein